MANTIELYKDICDLAKTLNKEHLIDDYKPNGNRPKKGIKKDDYLNLLMNLRTEFEESNKQISKPKNLFDEIKENEKKNSSIFYIQINLNNFKFYISSGIIAPITMYKKWTFDDVQKKYPQFIVLSNSTIISDINDNSAIVEVNLYGFNKINLNRINFIATPIPISRIEYLHLNSEKQKQDLIKDLESGRMGFFPEELIKVDLNTFIPIEIEQPKLDLPNDSKKLNYKLDKYDKVLGCLAFIKNIDLLYSDETSIVQDYSDYFIQFSRYFLQSEKNEFAEGLFSNTKQISPMQWLIDRVDKSSENFFEQDIFEFADVLNVIYSSINKRELVTLLESKKSFQNQEDKLSMFVQIFRALLAYGNTNGRAIAIARKDLPNQSTHRLALPIFALLGYFYGYSRINYREEIGTLKSANNELAKLFDTYHKTAPIRFKLNTKFEFYLIEAVYQYIFNGNQLKELPNYIDPKLQKQEPTKYKLSNKFNVQFQQPIADLKYYKITQKSITDKLNPNSETALEVLGKFDDKIPLVSSLGWFCSKNNIKPNFNLKSLLNFELNWRQLVSFNKIELENLLIKNEVKAQEFMEIVELDKKYK